MVFPHTLDGFQEAVAFCGPLDSFSAAAELACAACAAAAWEGGHDFFFGKTVEVLDDQGLDAVVQLVAVCRVSAQDCMLQKDKRLKRTRL